MGTWRLRAGACAARGFPAQISDAHWHPRSWPCVHAGAQWRVVPAQRHQLRGPEAVAVSDQDRRGVPMPRAVLLGGLDEALDLPVGEIFTAALDLHGYPSPAPPILPRSSAGRKKVSSP